MSENLCVRCGRPTPDGYACSHCAYRAGDQLHEIADMAPAARDVAHGFARRGGGGGGGKPGSSLPFDLGATSKLDAVQGELVGWLRHVMAVRGIPDGLENPWGDLVILAANFLAGHVEWFRHRAEADEFLSAVDACARVVRGLARGPAEQKYLGPCGAVLCASTYEGWICKLSHDASEGYIHHIAGDGGLHSGTTWDAYIEPPMRGCDGDVYASRGSRTGRCRTCGAEVSTDEREAWLDGEVRSHAFSALAIAEAHRINVKTIRTWANRGALRTYWRTEAGLTVEWAEPPEGETRERLHYVGDVLDLAAADAARREGERAKRARRAAAKAAEDERLSA